MDTASRLSSFLIVEIDPAAREQIEGWLRGTGVGQIFSAASIAEALEVLESRKIDCVIACWDLLGVSGGLGLLKLIKLEERFRKIAFVMVSSPGANEAEKVRAARAARAEGYLLKPLNEAAFKTLIEEIRGKHE